MEGFFGLNTPASSDARGDEDDDDSRKQLKMPENTIVESPLILPIFFWSEVKESEWFERPRATWSVSSDEIWMKMVLYL